MSTEIRLPRSGPYLGTINSLVLVAKMEPDFDGLTMFDLTGRTALVTGGAKGLGLVFATTLASAGADVIIAGRDQRALEDSSTDIQKRFGRQCKYIEVDLTKRGEARELAEKALSEFGTIDILISNAGTNTPQTIDAVSDDQWDALAELNLFAAVSLTRSLAPQMKAQKWGRVIYISSIMGIASKEGRSAYSATKAALIGLARAAALDLGPSNVTVNCIAPGPFLTDLPRKVFSPAEIDAVSQRTALLRWGIPEELAGPILLLASNAGSYITGSTLVVDGGALSRTM